MILNAQGLDPSINSASAWKLQHIIENYISPSIFTPYIYVTEGWLKPHITDAQVNIPNYQVLRADRKQRSRGGALLYIHQALPVSDEQSYDEYFCQATMCTIKPTNTIIVCVYRPPDTTEVSTKNLFDFISSYITKVSNNNHMDIIIAGDFNFPGIKWEDLTIKRDSDYASGQSLMLFMAEHLLSQYVDCPTRDKNILDLLLTNNSNLVLHINTEDTNGLSDHRLVTVTTKESLKPIQPKPKPTFTKHTFRNLKIHNADFDLISEHLSTVDWNELKLLCSEEEFPELFRLTVLQISELYCSTKSNNKRHENKFVKERRILNRKRRKLNQRLVSARNPSANRSQSKDKIEKLEKELVTIVSSIKKSVSDQKDAEEKKAIETIAENPSYFFSYSKRHSKQASTIGPLLDKQSNLQQNPKKMANLLQSQYSSVFSTPGSDHHHETLPDSDDIPVIEEVTFTQEDIISAIKEINNHSSSAEDDIPAIILKKCAAQLSYPILLIWRDSLESGVVPKTFKKQIITPVFKKGSRAKPSNYRPISLTSHIIKIFERILRAHIVKHLEINKLLCANQHGFRPGRSCLTQLLKHIDRILNNFLNGQDTDCIYLDFSKAFDKVSHDILIAKLYQYGIRGKLLSWFKSYLSDRDQTVVVNGSHSYQAKVLSGVPQGTVLGPILFLVYINDLGTCINHSIISHFADDTRISKAITGVSDVNLLQEDLLQTITWSDHNKMVLHTDKFELLCHTLRKHNTLKALPFTSQYFEYTTPDNVIISPSDIVRDLGVNITPSINWTPHINLMVDKARQITAWILSVFKDRSEETIMSLYKALIRSRLEYLSPLWNPTKQEDIKNIEGVQRFITSKVQGLTDFPYHDRLKTLGLMSLQRRRERFIIITVWKIINKVIPNELNFSTVSSERRGIKVKVPPLRKDATQQARSTYESSFGVIGPKLWNTLPRAISTITTKTTFKTRLTKYLSQFPDLPPVDGFASRNSLLDFNRLDLPGGRSLFSTDEDWDDLHH